ncbi:MAG TPA: mannitol dehydrogenase family protein [Anaerovoracaceae bacterium]|nr:mannitol dehydrogenase family protein [Anaerovoracaceae bacterium]
MKLTRTSIKKRKPWEAAAVTLPAFDIDAMITRTLESPCWVHFGPGNIFRGFIAGLMQTLLNKGRAGCGVIAAGNEIIDKIYRPHDNLSLLVTLNADGTSGREVIASIADSLKADFHNSDIEKLKWIFRQSSLQMVSLTITEKGYELRDMQGDLLPAVENDMRQGPGAPSQTMSILTALMLERWQNGAAPVALVSMDNCSKNGDKLRSSVLAVAGAWEEKGFAPEGFVDWLADETKVSFPWTMIDKITPRPSETIETQLREDGIEDMSVVVTGRNSYIAPFVNAEAPQYLVVEDAFPNGRPALEEAGVYFTDRTTVNDTERMKVTTCLNPLHTALAVFGCLLGYTSISDEMKDRDLKKLVELIGYGEGMPVVTDPKIIDPSAFIKEVIEVRFPNPFIPDTPQRIATDTSQKIPIRFGETIKAYIAHDELDVKSLVGIPLAIAAWLRYLLGIDDEGKPFEVSGDPLLPQLRRQLAPIVFGDPQSYRGQLAPILSNPVLFAADLTACGLSDKIETMFVRMLEGPGAVRNTLGLYLRDKLV